MHKWLKYDKGTIFRDKSKGGFLSLFLKDYKVEFGGSINPSCGHCLATYYDNFYKKYTMDTPKEKHGYVLKLKYNGIKSKVTGRPYRNDDLTEKQAIELIEKHPHGKLLFDKIPDSYYKKTEVKEVEEVLVEKVEKKAKRTHKRNK